MIVMRLALFYKENRKRYDRQQSTIPFYVFRQVLPAFFQHFSNVSHIIFSDFSMQREYNVTIFNGIHFREFTFNTTAKNGVAVIAVMHLSRLDTMIP